MKKLTLLAALVAVTSSTFFFILNQKTELTQAEVDEIQPAVLNDRNAVETVGESEIELPAVCFAPNTKQAVIDQFYASRNSVQNSLNTTHDSRFNILNRWGSTAIDGGGLGQGDVTTLTWSYVPDGTAIGNGGCDVPGESSGGSNFIAFFNSIYGSPTVPGDYTTAPWHDVFVDMFNSWSEVSGLNFVYEPNDDGATNVLNSGVLGVRGDMRISGRALDGNSGVLACNYFPNNGDMIIDTSDNFFINNPGLGTINVLTHEIGHGIGILHVCPVNQSKLMEPFVSFAFQGQQEDDILAANRSYGDPDGTNDSPAQAVNLGSNALPTSYDRLQRSIDDNSETDYFSFTISQAAVISGTLTPTGTTYLSGPQNANGSCSPGSTFNAQEVANLQFDILDTNGSTVLESGAGNGAGVTESVTDLDLPAAGTYYVRVLQEGGGVNNVQMYNLSINLAAAAVSNTAPVATAPAAPDVDEDDTTIALSNSIEVADVDGDDQTVTFSITGGILNIGTTNITFGGNGNGSSSFTATGSLSDINSALDAAAFTPTENLNGTDAGTISFTSNDGMEDSNTATVTFDISAVNDDPTLTSLPTDISVLENTASNVNLSASTFNDIDSDTGDVILTITAGVGTLSATSSGGVTVGGSANVLTLTGTASDIDQFLNTATNIQYTSPAGLSGDDATTLTIIANDNGNTGSGGGNDVTLGVVNVDISDCIITLVCPSNVTIGCNESTDPADTGEATATSNCDASPTITFSDTTTDGIITRTWTATDSSGATESCDQTITIADDVMPTASCQDITVQLDSSGSATITANEIDNGSTDNCELDTVSIDITAFDCSTIGENTVTLTVTDTAGNTAECTATVTIVDEIAPTITCPEDQLILVEDGAQYEIPDYVGEGLVDIEDNCTDPVTTITQNPAVGALVGVGTYTVTLTSEDEFGNSASCTFDLEVEDRLGINDVTNAINSITLYPNPTRTSVLLGNPKGVDLDQAEVYDLNGRLISSYSLREMGGELTLDVSNLQSGIYLVVIYSKGTAVNKKLVIE